MTDTRLTWEGSELVLSGPVTMATVRPLFDKLDSLLSAGAKPSIVLRCNQMTSSDSSAIALLLEVHRRVSDAGASLQVSGVRQQLASLMTIYGVDWVLRK